MKTSKFSLADLLTVLGALVFGCFCFLSLNFLSMGATVTSIGKAIGIAAALGGLALFAKLLKTAKSNFEIGWAGELVTIFLFVASAAYAIIFIFSHYFIVLERKAQIQTEVAANINQAKNLFTNYESYCQNRENIYKNRLRSVIAAKNVNWKDYRDYGFVNTMSDDVQLDNKLFTLRAKLFPSNYGGQNGIKQVAVKWLDKGQSIIENKWAFTFGIVGVLNSVETNVTGWKDTLTLLSTFRAQGENATDFDYALAFNSVKGQLTQQDQPNIPSVAYGVGLCVLMWLSYFVSKRSSKNRVGGTFIRNEKKQINPHIDINI